MKKALVVATVAGFIASFEMNDIKLLQSLGYEVHCAASFEVYNDKSKIDRLIASGVIAHNIPFSRSPVDKKNLQAYKKIKNLVNTEQFDIVHTHTPNASVCVRLACRKLRRNGLKVFYTAHGFHFHKGAPLKNWLLYYPVEKICSRWTDVLITINHEDYEVAKTKMHASQVEEILGVGIELSRFTDCVVDRKAVREELGIDLDEKVLIYVAELNVNKNQGSLLQMLAEVRKIRNDVKLLLVGKGDNEVNLKKQCKRLQLENSVIFTGYRSDIPALLKASDIAVPSSIREGFGLNVIEAMACKVPVVAYDNRGHRTIIRDGENGYIVPNGDYKAMAERVNFLLDNSEAVNAIVVTAFAELPRYSADSVTETMKKIYAY